MFDDVLMKYCSGQAEFECCVVHAGLVLAVKIVAVVIIAGKSEQVTDFVQ